MLIPEAGEATFWRVEGPLLASEDPWGRYEAEWSADPPGGGRQVPERQLVPAAEEDHRQRAARRTRSRLRRYVTANGLTRMWVLTFAASTVEYGAAMRAASLFRRRARRLWPDVPMVVSPEWHPGGHGWHVNVLVGTNLDHGRVREVWGLGHVWVSDWRKKVRRPGRSQRDVARAAARYLSKYVGKDMAEAAQVPSGAHRYEVTEGYQPERVRVTGADVAGVRAALLRAADGELPEYEWTWLADPSWRGPPLGFWSWA